MKKLLWLALGAALAVSLSAVAVVSGLPNPAIFTGTVSSIKACDAGFTRMGPNLCMRTDGTAYTSIAACTAVTLPTGAKALIVHWHLKATSANVAATVRDASVAFWNDSGCAVGQLAVAQISPMEEVASPSGNALFEAFGVMLVPAPAGGVWERGLAATSGLSPIMQRSIRGYYD